MVEIERKKLRKGMILANELLGKNNLYLKSGTVLTERFIKILYNDYFFSNLYIQITDESYNSISSQFDYFLQTDVGSIEELISPYLMKQLQIKDLGDNNYILNTNLEQINDDITIPGNLIISGDVDNCRLIYVNGNLTIVGNAKNSNIVAKGNISIQKDITNDNNQYKINCIGTFEANHVKNTTIKAHSIKIKSSIINSKVVATKTIEAPSAMKINNTILQAGNNLTIGSIQKDSTLIIFSDKQIKIVKNILEIENKLKNFNKEIEPLKQSIRVFQILRNKINELPDNKRTKLVENIKKFQEELEKQKNWSTQVLTLKKEANKIKESRENNPIIIEKEIEKGTKIIIDDKSLIVQMKDQGVVFYKKSIIIMGKKDKVWGKII